MPPRKPLNKDRRDREYLTEQEVDQLIKAAKKHTRYGHRNSTMILIAYRHALRVSELVNLKWSQIDLIQGLLHINRRKNGVDSVHPLYGVELRALKQLQKENSYNNRFSQTQFVFMSERRTPMTPSAFQKVITCAGQYANLGMTVHPHMLRHSCGFKLANDGQDTRAIQVYMGHKNIQHTVKYTELAPNRFQNFWND